jgi:xanthine/CO dehydrogenase XdhC/CoxF family maturation factor
VERASHVRDSIAEPERGARGGVRGIVAGLRAFAARGEAGVLAVVVATRGSTYRKPGALVLLDATGVRVGALSGGCLEAELEELARGVLASGLALEAVFDSSSDEDRVFGSGSGCGGSMQVWLLPVPVDDAPLRDALFDADAAGRALRLALDGDASTPGGGHATPVGSTCAYCFDEHGRGSVRETDPSPTVVVTVPRAPRLLLLGAGPETRPLLRHACALGWHVELLERRERWARFASGDLDVLHRSGDAPSLLAGNHFDAALVMHHNLELDARALAALAESAIGFVGLLGPPARRDELLRGIGARAADDLGVRLHAPVGLPLGGEGAESIALSIAAGLQRHFAAQPA